MEPTPDQLAGVVDLFGALSRDELRGAFEDLAARTGGTFDPDVLDDRIDDALREYYLVEVDGRLAVGPAALPALPEGGEDLPHILSIEGRAVDRAALADAIEERLRADAARAVDAGDDERVRELLDVCYAVDAWGELDTAAIRDRLDDALP